MWILSIEKSSCMYMLRLELLLKVWVDGMRMRDDVKREREREREK